MSWPISLLLALSALPEPSAEPAVYAIVLGNNHPLPGSGYEPLRYADDDALRFADLFDRMGGKVLLLTGPDRETARRFGPLADRASLPTRAGLEKAIDLIEEELEAAEGRTRELFFYFSGHGSMTSSKAYLHLLDGRFTRTDLYELILKRLPAERVHVIIDSCHSYFLVNSRGDRVRVTEDEETLDRYPAAGFLLSTSRRKEVHEWSGYQGGVFSYQVLGAMTGAADVNGDGVVSYPEVRGYVVAANLGVLDPRARIQPYVRKPTVRGQRLTDLTRLPEEGKVEVPKALEGHFHLVDERGGRLLDANKTAGQELVVYAPGAVELRANAQTYVVLPAEDGPSSVELEAVGSDFAMATRGIVEDAFRKQLFARPLTAEFVEGLDAAPPGAEVLVMPPVVRWHEDPVALSLLSAGVLGTAVGLVAGVGFIEARSDVNSFASQTAIDPVAYLDARDRSERNRAVMIGGLAAGLALLGSGLVVSWVRDEPPPDSAEQLMSLDGRPGPGLAWDLQP